MERKLQHIHLGGRRGAALLALQSRVSQDATVLPLCPGPHHLPRLLSCTQPNWGMAVPTNWN